MKLKDEIKIDPVTPDEFYNMPIGSMGKSVLDEWFCTPYIQTRGTQKEYFAVMCLDGGAWDRPTCKKIFDNIDDALEFAKSLKDIS